MFAPKSPCAHWVDAWFFHSIRVGTRQSGSAPNSQGKHPTIRVGTRQPRSVPDSQGRHPTDKASTRPIRQTRKTHINRNGNIKNEPPRAMNTPIPIRPQDSYIIKTVSTFSKLKQHASTSIYNRNKNVSTHIEFMVPTRCLSFSIVVGILAILRPQVHATQSTKCPNLLRTPTS